MGGKQGEAKKNKKQKKKAREEYMFLIEDAAYDWCLIGLDREDLQSGFQKHWPGRQQMKRLHLLASILLKKVAPCT